MQNDPETFPVSSESLARKHEVSDKSLRNPLFIAGASFFLVWFSIGACALTLHLLARTRAMQWMPPLGIIIAPNLKPLERFPAPHLEIDDDHAERLALYAAQEQKLNSYGWEDRSNGIIHIPIDRALDLIAQRGLPFRTNGVSGTDGSPLQLVQKIHNYK
ncbi:MAG: hypothetical protein ACREE6_07120 [Limisphaerales bacterium]